MGCFVALSRRATRSELLRIVLTALLGLCAAHAGAQSESSDKGSSNLFPEVHGIVSQGFIKTTQNNYLADSKRGSFEFSEAGINFTKNLTPEFRVGIQLFTHDLGPLGNYRTQFD